MLFLGLNLHQGNYQDFLKLLEKPDKKTLVFTPNPEIFVRASRDEEFQSILEKATYNVPDGVGLYVGYMMNDGASFIQAVGITFSQRRRLSEKYGELIKGSDLTRDILEGGVKGKEGTINEKRKVLIIDKKNTVPKNDFEIRKSEVQKNLKNIIESKYPSIIAYIIFSGERTPEEIAELIQVENIEYVFSCIGMKSQEKLLVEIFEYLEASQKVVGLGVGASIDFLLGLQKRAPVIFQDLGLEWLYRLVMQPRIRVKRIYDAVVEFPRIVRRALLK
ncbi:WecB/TagA/CpsF family glycosyltransferase [Candidatus Gracilibacteria bacterium]|nr:WecB/TagA/CpsF family glycosyltransferase [Candidatus Gracilibacteria bacterium]